MNHRLARSGRFAMAAVFTLVLAACGGGGSTSAPIAGGGTSGTGVPPGGGGTGVTGAPIVSGGAMVKGSVIVNGLRFDDTAAVIGDDRTRAAAQLANGMVVRVRGRSDDNVNGVAERVEVENEIRATIQLTPSTVNNTQSFVAGGVTVIVDSQTVYANVSGFAGLAQGTRVEVHGLRDANGNLRATRVEAVGATDGVDELRGTISGLTATQFTLNGNITVIYTSATVFSPAGTTAAALTNGRVVEVRGALAGNVFAATQVDVEDLEDAALGAKENEKTEYEGFVTDYTGSTTFKVAGRAVQTSASTRFVGGAAADLANNVKVEAEGVTVGGVLVASKIEFKQTRVLLYGRASAVNDASGTLEVLNQTVTVNAQTKLDTRGASGSSLTDLVAGVDCVEVRAYLDGPTLTAEEVKEPSSCSRELVQARVVAENETTFTLTFLNNLSASLGGAGTQFRNTAGLSISRAEFFAAVVPASASNVGTLVKVKGTTLSSVEEAELQN
jgi:hypothetical protein